MQKCKLFLVVLSTGLFLTNSLKGMDANQTGSATSLTIASTPQAAAAAAAATTPTGTNSTSALTTNPQNLDLCDTIQIHANDVADNPLVVHFIRNNLSPALIGKAITSCPDELKRKIAILKASMSCTDEEQQQLLNKIRLKGLILVGPPGTGKSTLAVAIALHCGIPFLFASAPGIPTEYKNSGPQNLHRIFREVQRVRGNLPTILIFDEIMGMIAKDKKQKESDPGISQQFQTLYDQIARGDSNIILIGTANDLEKLPDPIKDRFNGCIFEIPLPDFAKRKEALEYQLSNGKNSASTVKCDANLVKKYAQKTNGMSLRNISEMANGALERCYERTKAVKLVIIDKDFYESLASVQTNINNNKPSLWKKIEKKHVIIFGVAGLALAGIGLYFAWKTFAQTGKIADKQTGMGLLGMTQSLLSHDEQMLLGICLNIRSLDYQRYRDMIQTFIQLISEDGFFSKSLTRSTNDNYFYASKSVSRTWNHNRLAQIAYVYLFERQAIGQMLEILAKGIEKANQTQVDPVLLEKNLKYYLDFAMRSVGLTESGLKAITQFLSKDNKMQISEIFNEIKKLASESSSGLPFQLTQSTVESLHQTASNITTDIVQRNQVNNSQYLRWFYQIGVDALHKCGCTLV